jgi:hypothetical protein
VNVHAIEADAGDVFESGGGVHARLNECAVDDAEFHFARQADVVPVAIFLA